MLKERPFMKHSIVLFLSTIATQTINGIRTIRQTTYRNIQTNQDLDCIQTNESAVRYLQARLADIGESIDTVYVLTSKKVQDIESFAYDGQHYELSHVELFKKRLQDTIGLREEQFACIDYNESETVDSNMNKLLELAHVIREKHGNQSDELVHFDMTGGLRTVTQMLTSLLYLLKHSQVNIGYVLYSDFTKGIVENASELFDMNTLIAGIEEFTNYGSTRSLSSYFKDDASAMHHRSEACKELLEAMNEFSMAVSLCIPYKMVQAIKTLREKIATFIVTPHTSVKEDAFKYMMTTIEKEYENLLHRIDHDGKLKLAIIRWCVEKRLLQQALTLSTEWLPDILFQEKIFYHKELESIRLKATNQRTKEAEFVISYSTHTSSESPVGVTPSAKAEKYTDPSAIIKVIKTKIGTVRSKDDVTTILTGLGREMEALYTFIDECITAWDWIDKKLCSKSGMQASPKRKELLSNEIQIFTSLFPKVEGYLMNKFKQNPKANPTYGKFLAQQSQTLGKFLFQILGSVPEKTLLRTFSKEAGAPSLESSSKGNSGIKMLDAYRKDKILLYYTLLSQQQAHSILPLEQALQFIVEFHYIKQLRNTINHASEEQQMISSEDIITKIDTLLYSIETMHWETMTVLDELAHIRSHTE